MAIQKVFTGECPEFQEEATVTVTYEKYQPIGDQIIHHVPTSHKCNIGSFKGCSQDGCPLVIDEC